PCRDFARSFMSLPRLCRWPDWRMQPTSRCKRSQVRRWAVAVRPIVPRFWGVRTRGSEEFRWHYLVYWHISAHLLSLHSRRSDIRVREHFSFLPPVRCSSGRFGSCTSRRFYCMPTAVTVCFLLRPHF